MSYKATTDQRFKARRTGMFSLLGSHVDRENQATPLLPKRLWWHCMQLPYLGATMRSSVILFLFIEVGYKFVSHRLSHRFVDLYCRLCSRVAACVSIVGLLEKIVFMYMKVIRHMTVCRPIWIILKTMLYKQNIIEILSNNHLV